MASFNEIKKAYDKYYHTIESLKNECKINNDEVNECCLTLELNCKNCLIILDDLIKSVNDENLEFKKDNIKQIVIDQNLKFVLFLSNYCLKLKQYELYQKIKKAYLSDDNEYSNILTFDDHKNKQKIYNSTNINKINELEKELDKVEKELDKELEELNIKELEIRESEVLKLSEELMNHKKYLCKIAIELDSDRIKLYEEKKELYNLENKLKLYDIKIKNNKKHIMILVIIFIYLYFSILVCQIFM